MTYFNFTTSAGNTRSQFSFLLHQRTLFMLFTQCLQVGASVRLNRRRLRTVLCMSMLQRLLAGHRVSLMKMLLRCERRLILSTLPTAVICFCWQAVRQRGRALPLTLSPPGPSAPPPHSPPCWPHTVPPRSPLSARVTLWWQRGSPRRKCFLTPWLTLTSSEEEKKQPTRTKTGVMNCKAST